MSNHFGVIEAGTKGYKKVKIFPVPYGSICDYIVYYDSIAISHTNPVNWRHKVKKNQEKVCNLRASQMSYLCSAILDAALYSREDLIPLVRQQQKKMDSFIDSLPEEDD